VCFLYTFFCLFVSVPVILYAQVNVPSIHRQGVSSGQATPLRKTWQQYKRHPILHTVGLAGAVYGIYRIARCRKAAPYKVPSAPYSVSFRQNAFELVVGKSAAHDDDEAEQLSALPAGQLTLIDHIGYYCKELREIINNTSYCERFVPFACRNNFNGNNLFKREGCGTVSALAASGFMFMGLNNPPDNSVRVIIASLLTSRKEYSWQEDIQIHLTYGLQNYEGEYYEDQWLFGVSMSPSARYIVVIGRGSTHGNIKIYESEDQQNGGKLLDKVLMSHNNIKCQYAHYFDRIQFSEDESEVLLPESSLGSFSVFELPARQRIRGIQCLNLQVNTECSHPRHVFAWSSRKKNILCGAGTDTINVYNELGGEPIKTIRLSHEIAAVKTDHNGEFLGYNIGEKLWYRICIDTGSLLKLLPDGYTSTGNPDDILFLRDERGKQVLINIKPCEEDGSYSVSALPTIEVFDIQDK